MATSSTRQILSGTCNNNSLQFNYTYWNIFSSCSGDSEFGRCLFFSTRGNNFNGQKINHTSVTKCLISHSFIIRFIYSFQCELHDWVTINIFGKSKCLRKCLWYGQQTNGVADRLTFLGSVFVFAYRVQLKLLWHGMDFYPDNCFMDKKKHPIELKSNCMSLSSIILETQHGRDDK